MVVKQALTSMFFFYKIKFKPLGIYAKVCILYLMYVMCNKKNKGRTKLKFVISVR